MGKGLQRVVTGNWEATERIGAQEARAVGFRAAEAQEATPSLGGGFWRPGLAAAHGSRGPEQFSSWVLGFGAPRRRRALTHPRSLPGARRSS